VQQFKNHFLASYLGGGANGSERIIPELILSFNKRMSVPSLYKPASLSSSTASSGWESGMAGKGRDLRDAGVAVGVSVFDPDPFE
jgi:hypothetical protein